MKRGALKILVVELVLIFVSCRLEAQQYSLSTNGFDYIAFGTINVKAGCSPLRNYSFHLGFEYNPFQFGNRDSREQFKHISASLEGRYWPWFVNSGWFFSSALTYCKYSFGGIFTKKSYEGRALGVNLGGGYAWMLSKSVNLELGLGAFVGGTKYKRYSCVKCGVEEQEKNKLVVSPSDVLLAITIIF